jgi:hypothetical protein
MYLKGFLKSQLFRNLCKLYHSLSNGVQSGAATPHPTSYPESLNPAVKLMDGTNNIRLIGFGEIIEKGQTQKAFT